MARRLLPTFLVLALAAATVAAAVAEYRSEQHDAERETRALARQAAATATTSISATVARLQGASGLLRGRAISANAFRAYARDVFTGSEFTGVAFEPEISRGERDFFERLLKRPIGEPAPGGGQRPTEVRDRYFPVALVYPDTPALRTVLGFDIFSDPARRTAAQAAARSGQARITEPIKALPAGRLAITAFSPIYSTGASVSTPSARLGALRGFVSGTVYADTLTAVVVRQLPDDAEVRVADGERVLLGPSDEPDDAETADAEIAGRTLKVSVAGPGAPSAITTVPLIVIGGLLIALVLLATVLADRRERSLEQRRLAAVRRAERDSVLGSVAAALEQETSLDRRLSDFAEAVVPVLGDCCAIDLSPPGRRIRRTAIAAVDDETRDRMRALHDPPDNELRREVVAGTEPMLVEVDEELIQVASRNEEEAELRRSLGIAQAIVAPLVARSAPLGVMTLGMLARTERRFGDEDMALVREVAKLAGLAIDNARLFEQQRDIATTLQLALLPRGLPSPENFDVAARYAPGLEGTVVGGDFYDLFSADQGCVAMVGDVCGKGADAASLTALARHTLRTAAMDNPPAQALARLDEAVSEETDELTFCTAALVRIEANDAGATAELSSGGHPPPLLIRADGSLEWPAPRGPALGIGSDIGFDTVDLELAHGDTVLLYTDGVTEARRGDELFGEERLAEAARSAPHEILPLMLERIERSVIEFCSDGRPQDDMALLAIRAR